MDFSLLLLESQDDAQHIFRTQVENSDLNNPKYAFIHGNMKIVKIYYYEIIIAIFYAILLPFTSKIVE